MSVFTKCLALTVKFDHPHKMNMKININSNPVPKSTHTRKWGRRGLPHGMSNILMPSTNTLWIFNCLPPTHRGRTRVRVSLLLKSYPNDCHKCLAYQSGLHTTLSDGPSLPIIILLVTDSAPTEPWRRPDRPQSLWMWRHKFNYRHLPIKSPPCALQSLVMLMIHGTDYGPVAR